MKIVVRDDDQVSIGSLAINIKYLSSGLEHVKVRVRHIESRVWRRIPVIVEDSNSPLEESPHTQAENNAAAAETGRVIAINIALPPLPHLTKVAVVYNYFRRIPRWLFLLTGSVCLLSGVLLLVFRTSSQPLPVPANSHQSGPPQLVKGTPNYATILPAGKSILQLGGWTRISPPNRNPVYAFLDKLDGVQLAVSEQPLPASFQQDAATKIQQLAESTSATDKFEVGSTTVYINTAADNQQQVIFGKDNLLILIRAASILTNDQWASYVHSLG